MSARKSGSGRNGGKRAGNGKRRASRAGGAHGVSMGARLAGLFVLLLAGAGIWYGAQLVDPDGGLIARSMDADADAGSGSERPAIPAAGSRVRVEVLNGGGVRGVAASARDELRDAGFDVVHYGNAPSFGHEASTVLLRAGNAEAARAVADALGIETIVVEHEPSLLVEVTVILGSRWQDRATRTATPDPNS